ncbi:hypothetical protein Tco_0974407 [Tanacetum coccineum]|uniref:Uncharacterized protein n=1 Tax=Tanacetum coccineum TaxID=301880 RepID=A0ABQ5EBG8_9ASTR
MDAVMVVAGRAAVCDKDGGGGSAEVVVVAVAYGDEDGSGSGVAARWWWYGKGDEVEWLVGMTIAERVAWW